VAAKGVGGRRLQRRGLAVDQLAGLVAKIAASPSRSVSARRPWPPHPRYNATAPADAGSGGVPVHRINLKGNRKINHAIDMVAITQVGHDTPGRAYYLRKQAEGKTQKEALRALKRKISDAIYRQLVDDTGLEMGPGGQAGTTLQSSVTGPTPTAGSSDKPQPGPVPQTTPFAASS
jgi:hypothetical protein